MDIITQVSGTYLDMSARRHFTVTHTHIHIHTFTFVYFFHINFRCNFKLTWMAQNGNPLWEYSQCRCREIFNVYSHENYKRVEIDVFIPSKWSFMSASLLHVRPLSCLTIVQCHSCRVYQEEQKNGNIKIEKKRENETGTVIKQTSDEIRKDWRFGNKNGRIYVMLP